MKPLLFPFILLFFCSFYCFTQTVEPSSGVSKDHIQFEFEAQYAVERQANEKLTYWSLPSTLLRYGILKNVEFQFNLPVVKQELYIDDKLSEEINDFGNVQIGLALNLWDNEGIIPETALMVRAIIPIRERDKNTDIGQVVSLNMMNNLGKSLSLSYNIGFVRQPDLFSSGFYILNLTFEFSERIHFFMEQFGDFTFDDFLSHNMNVGFGGDIFHNLALDFSFGKGLNAKMNYVGMIVTWGVKSLGIKRTSYTASP